MGVKSQPELHTEQENKRSEVCQPFNKKKRKKKPDAVVHSDAPMKVKHTGVTLKVPKELLRLMIKIHLLSAA